MSRFGVAEIHDFWTGTTYVSIPSNRVSTSELILERKEEWIKLGLNPLESGQYFGVFQSRDQTSETGNRLNPLESGQYFGVSWG